jgi:hypothetical protein
MLRTLQPLHELPRGSASNNDESRLATSSISIEKQILVEKISVSLSYHLSDHYMIDYLESTCCSFTQISTIKNVIGPCRLYMFSFFRCHSAVKLSLIGNKRHDMCAHSDSYQQNLPKCRVLHFRHHFSHTRYYRCLNRSNKIAQGLCFNWFTAR